MICAGPSEASTYGRKRPGTASDTGPLQITWRNPLKGKLAGNIPETAENQIMLTYSNATPAPLAAPMAHPVALDWLCMQPTPYNQYFFQALAADPTIDLTVHYSHSVVASHPWQTLHPLGYRYRFNKPYFGLDWNVMALHRSRRSQFSIIGGWQDPTMRALLVRLAILKHPFALWTDTPNLSKKRGITTATMRTLMLPWLFSRARAVFGTGRAALLALGTMGCPEDKLVNLPFFVNLDVPAARPIREHRVEVVRFISCGRLLNKMKGHDVALDALATARQVSGRDNFTYSIAGVGPDRQALQNQVETLGLKENVRFLEWLEPAQVLRRFSESDVLIHSSRYDPYPVTVLEGMAAGLCVLGSDASGSVSDRICHGENGYVHPAGKADVLAGQIRSILMDPEGIKPICRAARRTAEQWPVGCGIEAVKRVLAAV